MGQSHRELIAWQKAMDFVMCVYRTTKTFPRDETYALAGQLRRAAVAVPTNIAEGQARFSPNEFYFFLGRARESLVEVETQLMIAQNLSYFTPEHGKHLVERAAELGKILNGLMSAIRPAA
ncbi:MAG: four helix bundle protein [Terriglobales bacterium]